MFKKSVLHVKKEKSSSMENGQDDSDIGVNIAVTYLKVRGESTSTN